MIGLPAISLPSATASGERAFCISGLSSTSRSVTAPTMLFGASMPMYEVPGIGVSRRRRSEPISSIRLSSTLVTCLTLTPSASFSAKRVIAGPCVISRTCASTLKVFSVRSICCARYWSSCADSPGFTARGRERKLMGGGT